MTFDSRHRHRRTSVALGVLVAVAVTVIQPVVAPSPLFGGIVSAFDPTAEPSAAPTPDGSIAPTFDPTPDATIDATVDPTIDPGAADASPTPALSAPPEPTPEPSVYLTYELSPGQQDGHPVGRAVLVYRLIIPAPPTPAGSPHVISGLESETCASCHAAHTSAVAGLERTAQPGLCLACHGTGATFDVAADFAGLPANDDSTASYYAHPVAAASAAGHVVGVAGEFAGTLQRHALCVDCHDPHDATATRPLQSTTGWTASGDIRAAAGVAVTNGGVATAPAYALVSRDTGASLTYEYQLCLKCHSGYTVLPTRSTSHPSWWALDKAVELNPANASYHPVEAVGRNRTAQLAASLAGTSPFKAWNFTVDSTIRCTNCHGDPSTVNQTASTTPLTPSADTYEPAHGSPNRGLLIAPYRDRSLKPENQGYAAQDFALCYLCHAERPFRDTNNDPSAPDTAFPVHGLHVSAIDGVSGSSLSIDSSNGGQGHALCAECHFRVHSTTFAYGIGDTSPTARATGYASLVNFSPNVQAFGVGTPKWVSPSASGVGSCTLTCHGFTHATQTYTVAPGTGFTASPTVGPAGPTGLAVQFTDATRYATTGTATWAWTFGDGGISSAQNPTHTYLLPGSYTVLLTVTRLGGDHLSMTMTRTSYITVNP